LDRGRAAVKAVVDTNVVAYLLLGTEPYTAECRAFWQQLEEAQAPALWEAELTNALWMAVRHGVIEGPEALQRLRMADQLGVHSVSIRTLWQGALIRASQSGTSAYDTLFVELAARMGWRFATFDAALLRAFPEIAARPGDLV
jgi:predicted nucleic acid-binding protein